MRAWSQRRSIRCLAALSADEADGPRPWRSGRLRMRSWRCEIHCCRIRARALRPRVMRCWTRSSASASGVSRRGRTETSSRDPAAFSCAIAVAFSLACSTSGSRYRSRLRLLASVHPSSRPRPNVRLNPTARSADSIQRAACRHDRELEFTLLADLCSLLRCAGCPVESSPI